MAWSNRSVNRFMRTALREQLRGRESAAAGAKGRPFGLQSPATVVEPCQGQIDGFGKAVLGVVPLAVKDKMKKPFPTRSLMVP